MPDKNRTLRLELIGILDILTGSQGNNLPEDIREELTARTRRGIGTLYALAGTPVPLEN